jgi:hypothetical protein
LFLVFGGKHDYRRIELFFSHLAAYLKAIDLWKHDIEDNQVCIAGEGGRESLFAIHRCPDLIALCRKIIC